MSRALENILVNIHDSLHQYCNNSDCFSKGFFTIPKLEQVVEEQVNLPKEHNVPPKRFDEIPSITSNRQKRIKKSTTLKLEEVNAITSPYGWNSKNVNQDQPWEVVGQCLEQNQSGTFGNNFKDKNDLASPLTWPLDENKPMKPTYFSKAVGNKSTTG